MPTWRRNIVIDGSWLASPAGIRSGVSGGSSDPKKRVTIYEKRVAAVLDRIYGPTTGPRSWTGWLLLNAIGELHRTRSVRIVPPFRSTGQQMKARRRLDRCQAAANPAAAGCTGNGSSVAIWYEPTFWDELDSHYKLDPFALETLDDHGDRRSDDVLVHELFHALQAMTGSMVMGTTANLVANGWVSHREFQAVLIENIYRAETKRTEGLRGDYALPHHRLSSKPGGADLVTSDKNFYRAYRHEINVLYDSPKMNTLIGPMTSDFIAPSVWNPIRARRIVEREDVAARELSDRMYGPGSALGDLLTF